MDDAAESEGAARPLGILVKNSGEPIRLAEINVHGVAAEAVQAGQVNAKMWTRFVLTSDQAVFHRIVGNLAAVIEHSAQQMGRPVKLDRFGVVLLVMHPDNTGELWLDTAAMVTENTLKRPGPLAAGTVLFESDIADVRGVWFPCVEVGSKDRILCILREGWRFGVLFDGNQDDELSIDDAKRDLGRLYRSMKYADLYGAMTHEPTLAALVAKGWFPFLELMSGEFRMLLSTLEAGFELDGEEVRLIEKFDEARLERMFSRWMERSHLKEKEPILRSAINAYKARDPVSVIKNVLSEVEGVLSDAYFRDTGERTHRIEKLLKFVIAVTEQRAGKDTLFFPTEFGAYLKDYTYAGFNPGDIGSAGSRHAVGHGAVKADQYTMTRALQALLTLDQLAFYT